MVVSHVDLVGQSRSQAEFAVRKASRPLLRAKAAMTKPATGSIHLQPALA